MPKEKGDTIQELKSQAQRIWLAGLGAFAEAEKKSDELFRNLVKEGQKYESTLGQAGDTVRGTVTAAKNQAGKSLQELESALDRRVAAAMKRLGVASREDVEKLRREVASLSKSLKKTQKSTSAKRKVTPAKPRAKATKKKTARKAKKTPATS